MSSRTFRPARAMRWAEPSARAGRNEKPAILLTAVGAGLLEDPVQFRIGLEDAWTGCEWPGRAADYELWLHLFELAGSPGHYLEEHQLREVAELPERLSLYRAAAERHELGLSWTTSFERAYWFATCLGAIAGRTHKIYQLDTPRDIVLAHFHESRGESEYVIDISQLSDNQLDEVRPEEWEYLLAAGEN